MKPRPSRVPGPTVSRLSIYARCLESLVKRRIEIVSSEDLAARAGVNAAQVRKDLSYLGSFGRRGVGYDTRHLYNRIAHLLGLTKERVVAIIGVGKLGSALLAYKGFRKKGFKPVATFDTDKAKIGRKFDGIEVYEVSRLKEVVKEKGVEIGVITVPAEHAQAVADELVAAGVKSILNFAPVVLKIPPHVVLRQVDLSLELEAISYYINTDQSSQR